MCDWVRDHFRCDECEGHKLPKARRPTAVPRSYRFNHVVGVDLVEIKFKEQAYFWLNIICWGTQYQQVMQIDADHPKQPMNVWRAFVEAWVRIFGVPEMVVIDPGTEFKGEFADQCQS